MPKDIPEIIQNALDYAVGVIRESDLAPYVEDVLFYGVYSVGSKCPSTVELLIQYNDAVEGLSDCSVRMACLVGSLNSWRQGEPVEVCGISVVGDSWKAEKGQLSEAAGEDGVSLW